MIRSAAAFGAHLVLLGSACCDAWYRHAVRCSMGHVFEIPIVRCDLVRGHAMGARVSQKCSIHSAPVVLWMFWFEESPPRTMKPHG